MVVNKLLNELVDACSLTKDDTHKREILLHVFLSLKALKLEATIIQFNHARIWLVNETDFQINPDPIPFR
jgi:hypothetical protein